MVSIIKVDQIQNVAGGAPTAGDLGLDVSGNVVQVVSVTDSSGVYLNTTSFAATGLTATITPKYANSKILIQINSVLNVDDANGAYAFSAIYRNNSVELINAETGRDLVDEPGVTSVGLSFLDSPATTSATTYTLYGRTTNSTSDYRYNHGGSGGSSTINLLEIAG